jgi:hypothetical protein
MVQRRAERLSDGILAEPSRDVPQGDLRPNLRQVAPNHGECHSPTRPRVHPGALTDEYLEILEVHGPGFEILDR